MTLKRVGTPVMTLRHAWGYLSAIIVGAAVGLALVGGFRSPAPAPVVHHPSVAPADTVSGIRVPGLKVQSATPTPDVPPPPPRLLVIGPGETVPTDHTQAVLIEPGAIVPSTTPAPAVSTPSTDPVVSTPSTDPVVTVPSDPPSLSNALPPAAAPVPVPPAPPTCIPTPLAKC